MRPKALPPTTATDITQSSTFQNQVFKAISVQRPVVIETLRALRREKPNATPEQILREMERRYVTTVTVTSTGVGASAAIPGVGIPIALGLGGADLLFFYEATALYALSVAELHGVAVTDKQRAQPLILGMLLGQKSNSKVTKMVMHASGAGNVDQVRSVATNTVGKLLPRGWGDVLTQQLPDSALAPVATVIAREALKTSAILGAGTLGKVVPFGVGAIVGGVGSYTFGRDVVMASRFAFTTKPTEFPESLIDFQKPVRDAEGSRAARAFGAAKIVGASAITAVAGTVSRTGKRVTSILPGKRNAKQTEHAEQTEQAEQSKPSPQSASDPVAHATDPHDQASQ